MFVLEIHLLLICIHQFGVLSHGTYDPNAMTTQGTGSATGTALITDMTTEITAANKAILSPNAILGEFELICSLVRFKGKQLTADNDLMTFNEFDASFIDEF